MWISTSAHKKSSTICINCAEIKRLRSDIFVLWTFRNRTRGFPLIIDANIPTILWQSHCDDRSWSVNPQIDRYLYIPWHMCVCVYFRLPNVVFNYLRRIISHHIDKVPVNGSTSYDMQYAWLICKSSSRLLPQRHVSTVPNPSAMMDATLLFDLRGSQRQENVRLTI